MWAASQTRSAGAIATAHADIFAVIAWMAITMALMLATSRLVTKDPVRNLCFCYLNIGWLGLPIAVSLFGDGAATLSGGGHGLHRVDQ